MEKVDVIINVYGKPWQTLCSLKSLMKYSGDFIDKIYFIEEKEQPYNEDVSWLQSEFNNLIYYKPNKYCFTPIMSSFGDLNNLENRYNFRYQYGLEKSDKKYCFILHNDILFTGDIIGEMLNEVDKCAGIGLIGQCWNCPAFNANLCNGDRIQDFNPTYSEVVKLCQEFKPARNYQFLTLSDRNNPMPLPECRLNEFACLVNKEICLKECQPNGNSPFFGSYDILDLGDAWFRSLWLKGYMFKNYDINKTSIHGYYSQINSEIRTYSSEKIEEKYVESKFFVSGYPTQLDHQKYIDSEKVAKEYYEYNFKINNDMKKVFIDGGARIGETLYMLLDKRPDLLGCDVYFFECNENHISTLENIVNTNKGYNFILKQEAIWNKNEIKDFYITNDQWGDLGCTLKSEKREKMDLDHPQKVKCIDFSEFLSQFDDNIYLVVKLDIEGAEYEVLENIIESGMINKVNELYVEFHDNFFKPGISDNLKQKLLTYKNLECHFDWE